MAKVGRISMTVVGGPEVRRAFEQNRVLAEKALAAGIYAAGSNLMTQSKAVVPVDEGVLRGSGYCTLPEKTARGPVVEIGFGGPAAGYAERIHEVQYRHPQHTRENGVVDNCGGDWKYLERPVDRARPTLMRFIGRVAAKQFRAGSSSMPAAAHPQTPDEGGA